MTVQYLNRCVCSVKVLRYIKNVGQNVDNKIGLNNILHLLELFVASVVFPKDKNFGCGALNTQEDQRACHIVTSGPFVCTNKA